VQIKIFSAPQCIACDSTKMVLRKAQVGYTEVDVTKDSGALDQCKAMGFSELPVVVAGEQSWSGFRYDLLKKLTAA